MDAADHLALTSSRHAVSIVSQYPYRNVQIILRLYKSPTEVLVGFDIDACSVGFNGNRVWATPRAVAASLTQTNTVDMTRRSPLHEMRLAKYADRGFKIYIPDLQREQIDPSIYERGPTRIVGLAKLLVLEKLKHREDRDAFIDARRKQRGMPGRPWYERNRTALNYVSVTSEWEKKAVKRGEWMEKSTYESSVIEIPYGPRWNALRVQKLLYRVDVLVNSKWNPKVSCCKKQVEVEC